MPNLYKYLGNLTFEATEKPKGSPCWNLLTPPVPPWRVMEMHHNATFLSSSVLSAV